MPPRTPERPPPREPPAPHTPDTQPGPSKLTGLALLCASATGLLTALPVAPGQFAAAAAAATIGTGTAAAARAPSRRRTARRADLLVKLEPLIGAPRISNREPTLRYRQNTKTRFVIAYPSAYHPDGKRRQVEDLVNTCLPGRWHLEWDQQHNQLTAHQRPDMPDRVDRPHRRLDPDRFGIGVDGHGDTRHWQPSVMPHCLVVGSTGAGKSVTLSGLIMHAAATGWQVHIVDAKGVTLAGFRDWPGVAASGFGDAEPMSRVLVDTETLMRQRYAQVRDGTVSTEDLRPVLLVIDEAAEMVTTLNAWWADQRGAGTTRQAPGVGAWKSVARLGREARVHMVFGIQQAAATFFGGTEARDQFACRVALGPTTQQSADMAFGVSWAGRDVPVAAKGRATVAAGDGASFVEVQTFYSPELRPSGAARHDGDRSDVDRWRSIAAQQHPVSSPVTTVGEAPRGGGHTGTTVDDGPTTVDTPPGLPKPRTCGRCGKPGHNRRTCTEGKG